MSEAAAAPATMLLTYKYRLNPTRQQHRALEGILEQQRQLYNAALEERIDCYRKTGKSITEYDQSKSLTAIRGDDPAFAEVQRRIQRGTLKRLDLAYKAFFRRAKAGAGAASGFPRFKGREYFDGFSFDAWGQIRLDGKRLRFAGMPGGLRVHFDRPLPETIDPKTGVIGPLIKGVWFKRVLGRWYVGLQVAAPKRINRNGLGKGAVGVDWGTSVLAALSTGEMIANPRHGEMLAKAHARAQRAVSRKRKGSKRRMKARRHLQRVAAQAANRRRNTMDKVSKRLVTHFQTVAVEQIEAKQLMDAERIGETLPEFVKTRRNRETLDAAPFMLRQMLAYKAERAGATLIVVDPKHTTQECAWCGGLHFKELSDVEHRCTAPGLFFNRVVHRKVNAAKVILQRGLAAASQDAGRRNGGGPVPEGAVKSANGGNGRRRPGNTETADAASGRRPGNGSPITTRTHDPKHRLRSQP